MEAMPIDFDPGSPHKNEPAEYTCPRCRCSVDRFRQKYCSECGQKLDWGTEETDRTKVFWL